MRFRSTQRRTHTRRSPDCTRRAPSSHLGSVAFGSALHSSHACMRTAPRHTHHAHRIPRTWRPRRSKCEARKTGRGSRARKSTCRCERRRRASRSHGGSGARHTRRRPNQPCSGTPCRRHRGERGTRRAHTWLGTRLLCTARHSNPRHTDSGPWPCRTFRARRSQAYSAAARTPARTSRHGRGTRHRGTYREVRPRLRRAPQRRRSPKRTCALSSQGRRSRHSTRTHRREASRRDSSPCRCSRRLLGSAARCNRARSSLRYIPQRRPRRRRPMHSGAARSRRASGAVSSGMPQAARRPRPPSRWRTRSVQRPRRTGRGSSSWPGRDARSNRRP
jgi:hypothetical protein